MSWLKMNPPVFSLTHGRARFTFVFVITALVGGVECAPDAFAFADPITALRSQDQQKQQSPTDKTESQVKASWQEFNALSAECSAVWTDADKQTLKVGTARQKSIVWRKRNRFVSRFLTFEREHRGSSSGVQAIYSAVIESRGNDELRLKTFREVIRRVKAHYLNHPDLDLCIEVICFEPLEDFDIPEANEFLTWIVENSPDRERQADALWNIAIRASTTLELIDAYRYTLSIKPEVDSADERARKLAWLKAHDEDVVIKFGLRHLNRLYSDYTDDEMLMGRYRLEELLQNKLRHKYYFTVRVRNKSVRDREASKQLVLLNKKLDKASESEAKAQGQSSQRFKLADDFLKFEQEYRGTDAALNALKYAVYATFHQGVISSDQRHPIYASIREEVVARMAKHYLNHPGVVESYRNLLNLNNPYSSGEAAEAEAFFRTVVDGSHIPRARAAAMWEIVWSEYQLLADVELDELQTAETLFDDDRKQALLDLKQLSQMKLASPVITKKLTVGMSLPTTSGVDLNGIPTRVDAPMGNVVLVSVNNGKAANYDLLDDLTRSFEGRPLKVLSVRIGHTNSTLADEPGLAARRFKIIPEALPSRISRAFHGNPSGGGEQLYLANSAGIVHWVGRHDAALKGQRLRKMVEKLVTEAETGALPLTE